MEFVLSLTHRPLLFKMGNDQPRQQVSSFGMAHRAAFPLIEPAPSLPIRVQEVVSGIAQRPLLCPTVIHHPSPLSDRNQDGNRGATPQNREAPGDTRETPGDLSGDRWNRTTRFASGAANVTPGNHLSKWGSPTPNGPREGTREDQESPEASSNRYLCGHRGGVWWPIAGTRRGVEGQDLLVGGVWGLIWG